MAANTPIKYSDLISPDGSIDDLIKKLNELCDTYQFMAETVKKEASQVADSLKNVNASTESGRKSTRSASSDADRLAKAYRDLDFSLSDTQKKIQELNAVKSEQKRINKLMIQLNASEEGSYNKLSAQYSLNKIQLNAMSQAEREGTAEGRKLEEETKAIYEEMKRLQEATGKHQLNVGNYKEFGAVMEEECQRIEKLTKMIDSELVGSYNRLKAQYELNLIKYKHLSDAQKNDDSGKKLIAEIRQQAEELKRMNREVGVASITFGDYNQKIQSALGLTSPFASSVMNMAMQGGSASAIIKELSVSVSAFGKTLLGLLANPVFLAIAGIASAGMAFKWWFDYNKGLAEATRLTREFTGYTGDRLVALRNDIQATADVFGKDYKDVLKAVDNLMAQYHMTGEEALKVVNDGFVSGADLSGNMLSLLEQYAPAFHDAGIEASELMALIAQTRSGIFSEKGLALIQMASKKIREMSKSTQDALNGIGISAAQVEADLQSGAKSTFDVIQEISTKLKEMPQDGEEVGAVLKDVFGKQGASGGLEMIKALDEITTKIEDVKAVTGEYGKLQERELEVQGELNGIMSAFFDMSGSGFEEMLMKARIWLKEGLVKILKGVAEIINSFIDWYNTDISLRASIQAIGFAFSAVWATIKLAGNLIIDAFKAIGHAANGIGTILEGIFTFSWSKVKAGWNELTNGVWSSIKEGVQDVGKYGEEMAQAAIDGYNNTIQKEKLQHIEIPTGPEVDGSGGQGKPSADHGAGSGSGSTYQKDAKKAKADWEQAKKEYEAILKDENATSEQVLLAREKMKKAQEKYDELTDQKGSAAAAKQSEKEKKAQEKRVKALEAARKKEIEIINRYNKERIDAMADGYEKDLETLKTEYENQKRTVENSLSEIDRAIKNHDYLSEAELKALTNSRQTLANELVLIEQVKNKKIEDLNLKHEQDELKNLNELINLRLESETEGTQRWYQLSRDRLANQQMIDRLEVQRSTKSEEEKKKALLAIDEKYNRLIDDLDYQYRQKNLADRQALNEQLYENEGHSARNIQLLKLQHQKEELQNQLRHNKNLTEIQKQGIQAQIDGLNKQMDRLPYNDIYDLMGLDMDDQKKQAIQDSVNYAMQAMNQLMQFQSQMAQEAVNNANTRVSSAEAALQAELTARANGYANNVKYAQKELADAKKNQQKALEQQRKTQRAQIALDAATQVSSLITASANIWKAFTGIGPWGVAAAIAAIGLMWGSFAASKIMALKAVNDQGSESYGEGTVELLHGGSHQSGRDIDLGSTPDGKKRRAEGGEIFAVFRKKASRENRDLIFDVVRSFNDGTFNEKFVRKEGESSGLINYLEAYRQGSAQIVQMSSPGTDISSLSQDVRRIREQGDHREYFDGEGNRVIVNGNHTRIIKAV